jgi:hypothetical protein
MVPVAVALWVFCGATGLTGASSTPKADAAKTTVLFITVHPVHDTLARLPSWLGQFKARAFGDRTHLKWCVRRDRRDRVAREWRAVEAGMSAPR